MWTIYIIWIFCIKANSEQYCVSNCRWKLVSVTFFFSSLFSICYFFLLFCCRKFLSKKRRKKNLKQVLNYNYVRISGELTHNKNNSNNKPNRKLIRSTIKSNKLEFHLRSSKWFLQMLQKLLANQNICIRIFLIYFIFHWYDSYHLRLRWRNIKFI